MSTLKLDGVGLGLRRDFFDDVLSRPAIPVDFWEIAPDNWIALGGKFTRGLRRLTEQYPFVCHGLSLNLGGIAPLDMAYIRRLKGFLNDHDIVCFSEHLSYCGDQTGLLYDLMPIPFTEEAVFYVADRIRQVQDTLERTIAIENVSFYAMPSNEMTEIDFINAVIQESKCHLLLDVNNIFVNSINHQYDAPAFMHAMPNKALAYFHMAGHYDEAEDLKIDTHGSDVTAAVWQLLDQTYQYHGVQPTLLERDFNIPPLDTLLLEVEKIRLIQQQHLSV